MDRLSYVFRRLLQLIPVVFGVTLIVFFMIHLVPGDPARTMLGVHATPEAVARLHKQWGLDQPLINQYLDFMDRLLHGDLGESLFYSLDVSDAADASGCRPTLWLLGMTTIFAVMIAVPLATLAATKQDSSRDQAIRAVPLFGLAMPAFWVGIILILLFAPPPGPAVPGRRVRGRAARPPALDDPAGVHGGAGHLADPDPQPARQPARTCSSRDYITTARSKGISERRVSSATRSATPSSRWSPCSA